MLYLLHNLRQKFRRCPKAWGNWCGLFLLIFAIIWIDCGHAFAQQSEFAPLPTAVQAPIVDVEGEDFRIWTSEDGLASNAVRAMAQTQDGYLWFGTISGLSRFDGRRFVNFDPKSDPPLPGGNVTSLLADDKNQLFVAVRGAGLFVYDGTAFDPVPGNDRLREVMADGDQIGALHLGDDESMWFVFGFTNVVRLHSGGRIERWPATSFAWPNSKIGANDDGEGDISPFSDVGLLVPSTQGLSLFRQDTGVSNELPFDVLFCPFTPSRDGGAWVGTWVDLLSLDASLDVRAVTRFPERTYLNVPLEDESGTVWIMATTNLFSFDPKQGTIQRHVNVASRLLASLRGPLQDHEGNIWVTSAQYGVGRLRVPPIRSFSSDRELPASIPQSLAADEHGRLHMAGVGFFGVQENGEWTKYKLDTYLKEQKARTPGDFKHKDLVRHECVTLDAGNSEVAWYGLAGLRHTRDDQRAGRLTFSVPLLARRQGGEIEFFDCPDQPDGVWSHYCVVSTIDQGVWMATDSGMFHSTDEGMVNWSVENGFPKSEMYRVIRDRADNVWFGGEGTGLYRVNGNDVRHWTAADGLASDTVLSIHEDEAGTIWVGGESGLSRVTDDEVTRLVEGADFLKLSLREINQDGEGNFWFGTPSGLFHVNGESLRSAIMGVPNELSAVRFGRTDGMRNEEVFPEYGRTSCRLPSGELVFCVEGGIVRFNPEQAIKSVTGPPIRILQCGTPEEAFLDQTLRDRPAGAPPLLLPPRASRALTFNYRAISFAAPDRIRYQYRLVGLSDIWTDAEDQNQAVFSRLSPGDYRFEVRAFNQNNAVSPNVATLTFQLAPYLHQRWSFRALVVVVILALTFALHRARLKAMHRIDQLEKRVAMDEERSRIARDVHDEIGSSLGQIRLLSELADKFERRHADSEGLARQIANVAQASSQSLRQIIWSLNPKRSTYDDLMAYLPSVATEFFEGTEVQLHIGEPKVSGSAKFSPAFKRDLILMLRGIMNNVVQHSGATEFRLDLEVTETELILTAADDGRGFEQGKVSNGSFGLQSLRERVENRDGTLRVSTAPGDGTTVEIRLPFDRPDA